MFIRLTLVTNLRLISHSLADPQASQISESIHDPYNLVDEWTVLHHLQRPIAYYCSSATSPTPPVHTITPARYECHRRATLRRLVFGTGCRIPRVISGCTRTGGYPLGRVGSVHPTLPAGYVDLTRRADPRVVSIGSMSTRVWTRMYSCAADSAMLLWVTGMNG